MSLWHVFETTIKANLKKHVLVIQAYNAMEEMKGRISGVNMAYYVNLRTIEAVHQALDIPLTDTIRKSHINGFRTGGPEEEDGEIVEEEVPMYNDDLWTHDSWLAGHDWELKSFDKSGSISKNIVLETATFFCFPYNGHSNWTTAVKIHVMTKIRKLALWLG